MNNFLKNLLISRPNIVLTIVTRNGKIVWKNGPNIEVSILCYVEVYRVAQNTGDYFKKIMAFPEGNKLFVGDLRPNLDETNADMV